MISKEPKPIKTFCQNRYKYRNKIWIKQLFCSNFIAIFGYRRFSVVL